jgi:1-acyl-sn-glycerol-3-phosphate acyltransferase
MGERETPQRGHALTRAFGRLAFRLLGFHFEGTYPKDASHYVMIVAPHTSNWDFVVGLMAKWALGLDVRFLAKHTLFKWPLGVFLRYWGGFPVDRRAAVGMVESAALAFKNSAQFALVITPEGTRGKTEAWKSGFYRIAHAAGVPILPVVFDYQKRALVFEPLFFPTGDYEQDLPKLQASFSAEMARHPGSY